MKPKIITVIASCIYWSSSITAQVPVREEPRHHPVLVNKYIRLLDVRLPPGDTTLFHIHATPSLFIILSNALTGSQIKGKDWVTSESKAGTTWYRSFADSPLIHRVCNADTIPFHVNDIEILSSFNSNSPYKHLPFKVLFENDKAVAYQLKNSSPVQKIINNCGPLVAELVSGNTITFHDANTKKAANIKTGEYLYMHPGSSFYFSSKGNDEINLVLFEIK